MNHVQMCNDRTMAKFHIVIKNEKEPKSFTKVSVFLNTTHCKLRLELREEWLCRFCAHLVFLLSVKCGFVALDVFLSCKPVRFHIWNG